MIYVLIFLLFTLGQIGRISLFRQEINGYFYEIVYTGLILYLLQKYRLKPFHIVKDKFPFFLAFTAWLVVTFVLSVFHYTAQQNAVALLYLVRLIFYLSSLFVLHHHLVRHPKAKSAIHGAFGMYCALLVFVSVIQYIFYPNLRNLTYLGWDPHQFRIFGTALDTSVAAALFGLTVIHLIFREKFERFLVIPVFIASLFTYARGYYISLFVTLGYYAFRTKKILHYIAFVSIIISTLFMLPRPGGEGVDLSRTSSIISRVADFEIAMDIWQDRPVIGIGYNHIRYEKGVVNESHAGASFHSSFLIILITAGIVGLVFFVGMLAQFAVLSPVASYMTLFLAVYSLSDNIFLHPFVLFFYTTLIAYEMSLKKK